MKTAHNRNYQRIDNAINNAYSELLIKKGTPDVSITELCKHAKVNRTTFYKHYGSIHDITNRLEDELIYKLFDIKDEDKIGFEEFLKDPRPSLARLNKNLTNNYEYYKKILRPERVRFIEEKVINILMDLFKNNYPNVATNKEIIKKVKLNVCVFVCFVTGLYIQWFNGYLDCSIEEVSNHIAIVIERVHKDSKLPR